MVAVCDLAIMNCCWMYVYDAEALLPRVYNQVPHLLVLVVDSEPLRLDPGQTRSRSRRHQCPVVLCGRGRAGSVSGPPVEAVARRPSRVSR